jgi:two-component system, OmpR family, sensor kinase
MGMSPGQDHGGPEDDRVLVTLEHLLTLEALELETAMQQAAQRVAEVLGADKTDVFLYEPADDTLVAVGTSDTPMARREVAVGLDRLPLANGGGTVGVFQTGRGHLSRRTDQDPDELRGLFDELGVRSQMGAAIEVGGERRGVLMACSTRPEAFSEGDLRFLQAVARWVGLVAHRAVLVERLARTVAEESMRAAAEALIGELTPRQQEIAALVAGGLTNRQIADRLLLTQGTVANHVEQILRRLGFHSRAQIGVWAVERGLHSPDPDRGAS